MAGRFYTDLRIAAKMVAWANYADGSDTGLKDKVVLEPSAGDGAIVRCLPKTIRGVVAVESEKAAFNKLTKLGPNPKFFPVHVDFMQLGMTSECLKWPSSNRRGYAFDIAIANPPYENGQDVEHIGHMLELAPRAVVLVRVNVMSLVSFADLVAKRKLTIDRVAYFLGRPPFYGPDDKGEGARHDYCVLDLHTGHDEESQRPDVEFWRVKDISGARASKA